MIKERERLKIQGRVNLYIKVPEEVEGNGTQSTSGKICQQEKGHLFHYDRREGMRKGHVRMLMWVRVRCRSRRAEENGNW